MYAVMSPLGEYGTKRQIFLPNFGPCNVSIDLCPALGRIHKAVSYRPACIKLQHAAACQDRLSCAGSSATDRSIKNNRSRINRRRGEDCIFHARAKVTALGPCGSSNRCPSAPKQRAKRLETVKVSGSQHASQACCGLAFYKTQLHCAACNFFASINRCEFNRCNRQNGNWSNHSRGR
jgi:hypothetical protein